jgi:hypothetical protein
MRREGGEEWMSNGGRSRKRSTIEMCENTNQWSATGKKKQVK